MRGWRFAFNSLLPGILRRIFVPTRSRGRHRPRDVPLVLVVVVVLRRPVFA
jgi:hypothetical protein